MEEEKWREIGAGPGRSDTGSAVVGAAFFVLRNEETKHLERVPGIRGIRAGRNLFLEAAPRSTETAVASMRGVSGIRLGVKRVRGNVETRRSPGTWMSGISGIVLPTYRCRHVH